MTDTTDTPAKLKKSNGLLIKGVIGLLLIGGGGGGSFALIQGGIIGGSHETGDKKADLPKLIRKGEADPYAPHGETKEGEGSGSEEIDGEGGSEYRTRYYNFSDEFTANLRNSTALVQMSLACSTRRDGRVLLWLKKHELAIRSEILVVLADTPEEDAMTPEGKQRLQKRLTAAINKVLTLTEGFGGVDADYFKGFLVQ